MKQSWHTCHFIIMVFLLLLSACGRFPTTRKDQEPRTVTLLGGLLGEPQDQLESALAPFEQATGIDILYEGTNAFSTVLPGRVKVGNPPDVAIFPQPRLMAELAEAGELIPITSFMDDTTLTNAYPDTWLEMGSTNGTVYGIWYRASLKSLVWYNPEIFETYNYDIPTTWDELIALSEQIRTNGTTPWCLGLESGDATGWPATDWVEDIMLRTVGTEVYDQWITHEIPFTDEQVADAVELFGQIALNPDYIVGGSVGAISTPFRESQNGLVSDPPSCVLHRQANFIAGFFPKEIILGEDIDFFLLPGIDEDLGLPMLVAGDVFGMFNDTPEARALMEYLATPTPHEIWAQKGGFLSPHKQVSPSVYPDPIVRKQAKILTDAEVIRFDGSDMMPETVGTGTFWSGMVDYVAGTPVEEVLAEIEESWPQE